MQFCSNLIYLRKKKGLTQKHIAKLLGLSFQAIGLYEKGDREPTLENLIKLAQILGVSVDELLTTEFNPTKKLISLNIKYLRERENYSQEDMAKLLGYRYKHNYILLEDGEIDISDKGLHNISEFFGISINDLLKYDLSKGGI